MQFSTPIGDSARRVHEDQSRRVTASVMGDAGRGIHHNRKRLVTGMAAATIRDSVRTAIGAALKSQGMTHAEVAEAGAIAADRALALAGITIEDTPDEKTVILDRYCVALERIAVLGDTNTSQIALDALG